MFVDESALNERIRDRRFGWGPIGMPVRVKRWLKKTEQWLILLIYTLNRYKAPLIFKGAIIAKIFEN